MPGLITAGIVMLEICSAYYGATGVGLRGHEHHQGWEFHTGRLIEACLGKVSLQIEETVLGES